MYIFLYKLYIYIYIAAKADSFFQPSSVDHSQLGKRNLTRHTYIYIYMYV